MHVIFNRLRSPQFRKEIAREKGREGRKVRPITVFDVVVQKVAGAKRVTPQFSWVQYPKTDCKIPKTAQAAEVEKEVQLYLQRMKNANSPRCKAMWKILGDLTNIDSDIPVDAKRAAIEMFGEGTNVSGVKTSEEGELIKAHFPQLVRGRHSVNQREVAEAGKDCHFRDFTHGSDFYFKCDQNWELKIAKPVKEWVNRSCKERKDPTKNLVLTMKENNHCFYKMDPESCKSVPLDADRTTGIWDILAGRSKGALPTERQAREHFYRTKFETPGHLRYGAIPSDGEALTDLIRKLGSE